MFPNLRLMLCSTFPMIFLRHESFLKFSYEVSRMWAQVLAPGWVFESIWKYLNTQASIWVFKYYLNTQFCRVFRKVFKYFTHGICPNTVGVPCLRGQCWRLITSAVWNPSPNWRKSCMWSGPATDQAIREFSRSLKACVTAESLNIHSNCNVVSLLLLLERCYFTSTPTVYCLTVVCLIVFHK